jgi:hypothetical protein
MKMRLAHRIAPCALIPAQSTRPTEGSRNMMKLRAGVLASGLLLSSMLWAAAEPAKFVWFGNGEVLYPAGEFSAAAQSMAPMLVGSLAAWKCDHLTLLGAALWSWNCVPVASHPEMVAWAPLPAEIVDLVGQDSPLNTANRTLWNRYGGGFLLLCVLGVPILLARRNADAGPRLSRGRR